MLLVHSIFNNDKTRQSPSALTLPTTEASSSVPTQPDLSTPRQFQQQNLDVTGTVVKDRLFRSVKDARAVAQRVLHRGCRLLPKGEADYMLCLFTRHPDFIEKDLYEVVSVRVAPAPELFRDYDCFWIERKDGSKIDISFNKCATGTDYVFAKFVKAARRAIQENLEAFVEQEYQDGMVSTYCCSDCYFIINLLIIYGIHLIFQLKNIFIIFINIYLCRLCYCR